MLFVAGGQTPELLESVHQSLDAVAQLVDCPVEGAGAALIALAGNRGTNTAAVCPVANRLATVAFITDKATRPTTRVPPAQGA